MALFGTKKTPKGTKRKAQSSKGALRTAPKVTNELQSVLVRPHITEKAAQATAQNVYTFEVRKNATKADIASAVKAVYNVTPVKVGIVKIPASRVRLRTRPGYGKRSGMKKAYIYLKEGDRIDFSS
ncbi:MAG: 50S ribosomal protein L23 [Patescibacteria group bacterium UBA2163]